jgi:polyphosphate glucokinase
VKILVIDVGGTNVKVCVTGRKEPVKILSGPAMTAARMAAAVRKATEGWTYEAVSIGYPGPVKNGKPVEEPSNLAPGWVRFDYRKAFGCPVRIVNDASMQALGSYRKGRMLFLGLGTGLGSALVADGELQPLELGHLPYRHGRCYEDYAGLRGYRRLGRKRWTRHIEKIVALLKRGLQADEVVLGGGQMKKLNKLPPGSRPGDNQDAILGGYRLWSNATPRRPRPARRPAPSPLRSVDPEPAAPLPS